MSTETLLQDSRVRRRQDGPRFPGDSRAHLLYVLLAYKLFVVWLIFASVQLLPNSFSLGGYNANFHWPQNKEPGLQERFMTWDGEHYLYLSENGYQAGSPSAAFYPLWPAVIWAGTKLVGGHGLIAALVLSNIFSLLAWFLFHRLVAVQYGSELADWSTIFLIAYPGSLFFQFPYTESLFLLLIMVFFWGMERGNTFCVALAGFLLPVTRAVGLFCAIPVIVHNWIQHKPWRDYAPIGAVAAGWCAYLLVMRITTGNILEGFAAQKHYLAGGSITKLIDPIGFLNSVFVPLHLHGILNSAFDRLFFVCFVIILFPLYRMNKVYFTYAVLVGLVPAITNSFASYTRYLAVVFPVFIVMAQYFSAAERRHWRYLVIAILFAVQILFLLRHINFHWVG